ncbi:type VI toxin-antitoxin system SocA family antitoxin [Rhizobium sp. SYY.PMSO]|uniref:type VI toxin-antitoxin system SocA family antitoxin n=1 Tax=Rhizobium sp. SYY.PMSO TaxID=3382192 RepID=UPI000DD6D72C
MSAGYDPRAVANLMLDEAGRIDLGLGHIQLQKLLYFSHGIHLIQTKSPLVSGYFEAWQYGPVHPTVYRSFKQAGREAIQFRATGQDPLTGERRPIEDVKDSRIVDLIRRVLASYGSLPTGRLVDLSHAKDSPWWYVVEQGRAGVAFGMRISDSVIADRFRHHKVSVGPEPLSGEPLDDTPFA